MGIIKKCPICGNYVEGKRKQSYVKKVTKTGVKSAVNGAASIGAAGTGAAIGSAILPGIGTLIGGAAGLIGSAMFHTGVNDAIDGVADAVTDAEYEFTCPNCGHQWSSDDDDIDYDLDDDDDDDEEDEYDEVAVIDQESCINCGACAAECDHDAIDEDDDSYTIDPNLCTRCGACISECPVYAISFVNKADYHSYKNECDQRVQHEQEYLNHLKDLLEDESEITPRERKMLDRIRQNLGISEERAKELEEMLLNPQLTEEEQQYLDNVREFFEDDADISPRERKMLNRIRESLGISEERAEELEQLAINPRLTKDEQEYIDMYHDYAGNGKITDKDRRKLDKFASALGISAERAKELEKLA